MSLTRMSNISNGRVLEYLTTFAGNFVQPFYPVFTNTGFTYFNNAFSIGGGGQTITGGSAVEGYHDGGGGSIGGVGSDRYGYGIDQTIKGSEVQYRPPPGTKRVIYRFNFTISGADPIIQIMPEISKISAEDGTPAGSSYSRLWQGITAYRTTIRGVGYEARETIEFPIEVNCPAGTIAGGAGRLGTWNTHRTIRLNGLAYTSSYPARFHGTRTWNGGGDTNTPARPDGGNRDTSVSEPILSIVAIGGN
jgi:hypothetical protein